MNNKTNLIADVWFAKGIEANDVSENTFLHSLRGILEEWGFIYIDVIVYSLTDKLYIKVLNLLPDNVVKSNVDFLTRLLNLMNKYRVVKFTAVFDPYNEIKQNQEQLKN